MSGESSERERCTRKRQYFDPYCYIMWACLRRLWFVHSERWILFVRITVENHLAPFCLVIELSWDPTDLLIVFGAQRRKKERQRPFYISIWTCMRLDETYSNRNNLFMRTHQSSLYTVTSIVSAWKLSLGEQSIRRDQESRRCTWWWSLLWKRCRGSWGFQILQNLRVEIPE